MFMGPTPASNAMEGKHIIRFFNDWGKQAWPSPKGRCGWSCSSIWCRPVSRSPPGLASGGAGGCGICVPTRVARLRWTIPGATSRCRRLCIGPRWAAASGETGPFSKTLAARVEGFDRPQQMSARTQRHGAHQAAGDHYDRPSPVARRCRGDAGGLRPSRPGRETAGQRNRRCGVTTALSFVEPVGRPCQSGYTVGGFALCNCANRFKDDD